MKARFSNERKQEYEHNRHAKPNGSELAYNRSVLIVALERGKRIVHESISGAAFKCHPDRKQCSPSKEPRDTIGEHVHERREHQCTSSNREGILVTDAIRNVAARHLKEKTHNFSNEGQEPDRLRCRVRHHEQEYRQERHVRSLVRHEVYREFPEITLEPLPRYVSYPHTF